MTNRLKIVQGVTKTFDVFLADRYGDAWPGLALLDAVTELTIRATPAGADVALFTSPDVVRFVLHPSESLVTITLTALDTAALTLGAYFYQVKLTLTDGTVSLPIEWTPLEVGLGGAADIAPPTFDNTLKLNEHFPLEDDLRYMSAGGSPIDGAQVRVYYRHDYDAGRLDTPVGVTLTNAAGRWSNSILVVPGYDYTVVFFKPGEFGPDAHNVTAV